MKLLRDAEKYPDVLAVNAGRIAQIEERLGSLNISASIIPDLYHGREALGWVVWPEDESKVLQFPTFNWGPGSGPRLSLEEALDAIIWQLERCVAVVAGKPGLRTVASC